MNKESTYKKKIEYNQRVHKLCCRDGKYYCRAVHAVLDKSKDGVICGKGCPCFARIDDDGGIICEYYDLQVNNLAAFTPKQNKQRAQVLIDSKISPLFPNVWLKEGSRKTIMEKAYVYVIYKYKKYMAKNLKVPNEIRLIEVVNIITQLTQNIDVMVAGILHDIMAKTPVSKKDLEEEFGKKVTDIIVQGVGEKESDETFKNSEWQELGIDKLKNAPEEVKILVFAVTLINLEKECEEVNIKGKNVEDDCINYYKQMIEENIFEEFKEKEPYSRYVECINKLSNK